MTGSRNLGNFKQTTPLSDIVHHWIQKHFILFYTLRWAHDIRQAEVLSCVYPRRAIHVCALTFSWALETKYLITFSLNRCNT